jgi:hypothetical protein
MDIEILLTGSLRAGLPKRPGNTTFRGNAMLLQFRQLNRKQVPCDIWTKGFRAILGGFLVLLATACGSSDNPQTSTPTPTATSDSTAVAQTPSPAPSATPAATTPPATPPGESPDRLYPASHRLGIAEVDAVVAAVVAGDIQRLLEITQFESHPCKGPQAIGPGELPCGEGQPEGTLIPAVSAGTCEGGLRPHSYVEDYLGYLLEEPQFLHSAYGGPPTTDALGQDIASYLIFGSADADGPLLELPLNEQGRILGVGQRCAAFNAALLDGRPVLAPPKGDP